MHVQPQHAVPQPHTPHHALSVQCRVCKNSALLPVKARFRGSNQCILGAKHIYIAPQFYIYCTPIQYILRPNSIYIALPFNIYCHFTHAKRRFYTIAPLQNAISDCNTFLPPARYLLCQLRYGTKIKKQPRHCLGCFFMWYHQESNRGHKDFQSFALPTELWHQLRSICVCKGSNNILYRQTFAAFFFATQQILLRCGDPDTAAASH